MSINPVDIGVKLKFSAAVLEHLTDVVYESKLIYYSKSFDDKVGLFASLTKLLWKITVAYAVNGHSYRRREHHTNFALLVSKTFAEPFKEPISGKYIASLANMLGGGVLVQRLGDLLS